MDMLLDILGKIGFDWRAALFQFINFFIVFLILKKYAFTPIVQKLDERTKLVREGAEDAQKAKTELQMAQRKAQDYIDEAKVEANKVISAAQQQANDAAERSREKAKKEIELLVAQAKQNIESDKAEMRDELRKHTVELVTLAVEKILSEKINDATDKAYVADVLSSLKK